MTSARTLAAVRALDAGVLPVDEPVVSRNPGPLCIRCDLPAAWEGVCETCQEELIKQAVDIFEATLAWADKQGPRCPACGTGATHGASHTPLCPFGRMWAFLARCKAMMPPGGERQGG